MQRRAQWNGTAADLERLQQAAHDNCQCGEGKPTCPAHQMLCEQRVLDGLNFVRKTRNRYRREEFTREPTDG